MGLGNPVHGTIHPITWTRPPGNVEFRVTQTFGCTGVPAERPYGPCAHYHRAIDLGNGKYGAPVLAARAGTVRYVGTSSSGSLNIVLDHGNGVWTGYAHLSQEYVYRGQKVTQGQHIGDVGSSGATAPHLHFALKLNLVGPVLLPYGAFWGDLRGRWADPWQHLEQNS